jgi:hypothetical protein
MKQILFLLLFLPITFSFQTNEGPEKALPEEEKLVSDLNNYRKSLGLPTIPYSAKLTKVAQIHATDLVINPPKGKCNLHSWSGKTEGSACCYTADHKNAECMWNKPEEITGYKEKGYEISAMNTAPSVDWLAQWKNSKGHHEVIINGGIWKQIEWKAMGVAIRKPYAVIWFGPLEDTN